MALVITIQADIHQLKLCLSSSFDTLKSQLFDEIGQAMVVSTQERFGNVMLMAILGKSLGAARKGRLDVRMGI